MTVSGCGRSPTHSAPPQSTLEISARAVFFDRSELHARDAGAHAALNNDVALLISVKNALVREPDLGSYTLEVGVLAGAVTLYGEVATPEHRAMAEQIARSVRGVESVRSGIAIANRV